MSRVYNFNEIENADLIIDAVYEGGNYTLHGKKNEVLNKLIKGSGNAGGFRSVGSAKKLQSKLCILYSTLSDPNWPDRIDLELGRFTYYGDNKEPGRELRDTSKGGNMLLDYCFDQLHLGNRGNIPPFFIFTKAFNTSNEWSIIFRGLAVPGTYEMNSTEDLVAISKILDGQRFQNYRAIFTILDAHHIPRQWINDIIDGNPNSSNAPIEWINWCTNKNYKPYIAEKIKKHRNIKEQTPSDRNKQEIIKCIIDYFHNHKNGDTEFEKCAATLIKLMDNKFKDIDVTRRTRDGGRDAVGNYRIGSENGYIEVEFALEAKCWSNNCNVKATSRLISRLKHRQFGIFVTTSAVGEQAYKEIVEDNHPVIILAGNDIADILINSGFKNKEEVEKWLNVFFPNS